MSDSATAAAAQSAASGLWGESMRILERADAGFMGLMGWRRGWKRFIVVRFAGFALTSPSAMRHRVGDLPHRRAGRFAHDGDQVVVQPQAVHVEAAFLEKTRRGR